MRVYLSESYPGSVVMAKRAPGPGWSEAVDKPTSPPAPRQLSLTELIEAMSTALGPARPLQDGAGERFHQLAELRARAEGCSLAEAYRRQSASTPELWADVRNAAPRGS